jgi:N utilization substance protein B
MPVTDRNILRLGGYEILFTDTPGRVSVNEAIVLAKRYGDKNSPRFVNGVLDRLLKESLEKVTE